MGILKEKKWRTICQELIETGFFNAAERPKTLKAIRRVMDKMTDREVGALRRVVSLIFAPAPGLDGQVFPLKKASSLITRQGNRLKVMLYLSPKIERLSQKRIGSIVAHEFAHPCFMLQTNLMGGLSSRRLTERFGHGVLKSPTLLKNSN